MFAFLRQRRRRELFARPLPEDRIQFLQREVPYYALLSREDRTALHGHLQVLLDEKHFEAVAGMVLSDQMIWVIASQAAVLLLGQDMDYFPRLQSVIVYPETFTSTVRQGRGGGIVSEEEVRRVGESWQLGSLLLSWQQVMRDTQLNSSRNVIFHEFAHQIDQADGVADGWPAALSPEAEAEWAEVMTREYASLRTAVAQGDTPVLDVYGGTKPTEFFATLTEMFFMKPHLLFRHHPELFTVMQGFYRQDPRLRFTPS